MDGGTEADVDAPAHGDLGIAEHEVGVDDLA